MMFGLAPGSILQHLFVRERVRLLLKENKKYFIEVGSGNGYISNLLLNQGMEGIGVDLNESACINNNLLNESFIKNGKYKVVHGDFLDIDMNTKFDLVISSMVIEHLPEKYLDKYFTKSKRILNKDGLISCLVPSAMKYWGIEDEIAGHMKRYEFHNFRLLADTYNLTVQKLAGLTFPISNVLFRISNFLVKKFESDKLKLSQLDKTVYTGNRNIPYKTTFPKVFNLVLNPIVLYPFHVLQKMFLSSSNAMVIYAELKIK